MSSPKPPSNRPRKPRKTSGSRGRKKQSLKGTIISVFITAVLFIAAAGGLYVYWAVRDLPEVNKMVADGVNPSKWTQVLAKDGTPILSYGKFRHKSVELDKISPHFIQALLATEDRRYYQHFGIDPLGIIRAVAINTFSGRLSEGASTLTQQLAKNVFLSNERSLKRKIREAVLAVKLEQKLSKDEILTLYVNNIYFGEGAYGIQAASEVYFNKKPDQLTIDEAALLAGLPQAPSRFNPYLRPEIAKRRRNEVIANLYEIDNITEAQMKALQEKPLRLNQSGRQLSTANRAPYFNQYVMQQIEQLFDFNEQRFWHSGLKIYTTLDLGAQRYAQRAIDEKFAQFGKAKSSEEVALVTFNNKTGGVLAYIGGRDYQKSQFDRVRQGSRSPGSLFKIFTYTAAMEQGYMPSRVYLDEPIQAGEWLPKNYDGKHHGYMTIAKALIKSNNVVAVKVLQELTPATVVELARRMGIQSTLKENLSLTLGGSGVNLFEVASAVSVLGNQGERIEPYAIEKILDKDGHVVYEHVPMKRRVLDRTTVDTMVALMQNVITQGTGGAANIGKPAAGKTGTSDEHRDGWFVAFTPDITTGVWVGKDDNTPSSHLTGGGLPASIWQGYHQPYLANKLVENFDISFARGITADLYTAYKVEELSEFEADSPLVPETRALPPQDGALMIDPAVPLADGELMNDPNVPTGGYAGPPAPRMVTAPDNRQIRTTVPGSNRSQPPAQNQSSRRRNRVGSDPYYFSQPRQAQQQQDNGVIPVPPTR